MRGNKNKMLTKTNASSPEPKLIATTIPPDVYRMVQSKAGENFMTMAGLLRKMIYSSLGIAPGNQP
jgi:hypothetical protein